jgi:sensor histidine kinase YesM
LIVENVETNRVSLENELALIESYIQLEELRFKGKIGYEISIDETIERENVFLPPMVLQPFVENAIWHGLMPKEASGHIKIAFKEDKDCLFCTIEDDGVGRGYSEALKDKSESKTKSVGIKITEERLRLLNKKRLDEMIKIVDLKNALNEAVGTRVEINIPLA